MKYDILYFGTFAMVFLSVTIIFFVLWSNRQFKMQKEYNEQRDKFYLRRIEDMEHIVKKEIKELINILKNI